MCVGAWMRESVSVCVSVCAFEAKREMNRGREKKKRKIACTGVQRMSLYEINKKRDEGRKEIKGLFE